MSFSTWIRLSGLKKTASILWVISRKSTIDRHQVPGLMLAVSVADLR